MLKSAFAITNSYLIKVKNSKDKSEGALCRVIVGTVDVRRTSVVGPVTNRYS
jgi:hypothetical protein